MCLILSSHFQNLSVLWYWVLYEIIKKIPGEGWGTMEAVSRGLQWKVCPCAREAGSPQQLLSSKITVLSLHSKVNKGIGFTDQLPCLGSCWFGIKCVLICCFIWFKPKSQFWKNKSGNWKLVLNPDLLCSFWKIRPFKSLSRIKIMQ